MSIIDCDDAELTLSGGRVVSSVETRVPTQSILRRHRPVDRLVVDGETTELIRKIRHLRHRHRKWVRAPEMPVRIPKHSIGAEHGMRPRIDGNIHGHNRAAQLIDAIKSPILEIE